MAPPSTEPERSVTDEPVGAFAERRRSTNRFFYSKDQLLGRERIHLRRRTDKQRLVGHLALAAGLVGLSAWWVIPLHPFAGPVLLSFAPGRGVHLGDLPTLVFLAVAARSMARVAQLSRAH